MRKGTFEEREEEDWFGWPVSVEIELAVNWIKRNSSRCGDVCGDRFDWPLMRVNNLVPRQTLAMSPLDYS